ncbi:MAG: hypothetical protein KJZ84_06985 [Bryobacteraceae bacterium]|nr:hypothetical protein [Bryobacteraceae bacterium]
MLPFSVAVIVAVVVEVSVEAETVKFAELAPAGTVSAAGRLSAALLVLRDTDAPPPGAAALRVTVQVLLPPEVSDAGSQLRLDRVAGTTSSSVKLIDWPFNVPVTTTLGCAGGFEAVTLKVADVAPEGTTTVPWIEIEELLLESETGVEPLAAGWFRVTVQVLVAPGVKVAGAQERLVSSTGAWRVRE